MKKKRKGIVFLLVLFLLTGCAAQERKMPIGKNKVEEVLDQQINMSQKESQKESVTPEDTTGRSVPIKIVEEEDTDLDEEIDYDLTAMGRDMVYMTVYNLMVYPDEYIGKTIKIKGLYYAAYYELMEQYYHYVLIEDAAACCAQGLEFIWDEGQHLYPDEYPEDETEVVVTGIFETYQEGGEKFIYCRLRNSTLEIVDTRE